MSTLTPLILVRVEGQEVSQELTRAVQSVRLTLAERKADTGQLVISDPDAAVLDSRLFRKGARLQITMGWASALEIRGPYVVKSYKPNFPDNGVANLTVEFQDESHTMNRRQRRRRFSNASPTQIIQQIAEEHGLGYDVESLEGVRFTDDFPLLQANITDARLMQQLSERYGYVWGVEGGTLYFRRPVDLEALNQQSEVPVLSYRINDWSVKSFAPEIKFSGGRRRTGATNTSANVDLTNGTTNDQGVFQVQQAGRDLVQQTQEALGAVVRVATGQDTDDDEAQTTSTNSSDAQPEALDQRRERARGRRVVDSVRTTLGPEIPPTISNEADDDHEENEESEPGDQSGAATPQTEAEARRRAAARVVRASEIVEGTLVPTVASMRWRPQMALVLAGVGERLSGRYRVTEVVQTVGQTFATSLKVARETFRPSVRDRELIAATPSAGEPDSSTGAPARTSPAEERYRVDEVRARVARTRRVDGQDQ